jgi:hypothetical protein
VISTRSAELFPCTRLAGKILEYPASNQFGVLIVQVFQTVDNAEYNSAIDSRQHPSEYSPQAHRILEIVLTVCDFGQPPPNRFAKVRTCGQQQGFDNGTCCIATFGVATAEEVEYVDFLVITEMLSQVSCDEEGNLSSGCTPTAMDPETKAFVGS